MAKIVVLMLLQVAVNTGLHAVQGIKVFGSLEYLLEPQEGVDLFTERRARLYGAAWALRVTCVGKTPITGFTKFEAKLDAAVLAELRKREPGATLPHWT